MTPTDSAPPPAAQSPGKRNTPKSPDSGPRSPARITGRAVALGSVLVLVLVVTNPYLAFIVDYWTAGSGAILNGPVAALFLLVLGNGLLKRIAPRHAFTRDELLVAYAMGIISVALAQAGGLPYVATTTTLPFYMATPENQWERLIWPHIPLWLQLSDVRLATWFWEGSPAGAGVPWGAWVRPLAAWGSFVFLLMTATYCLSILVSKDWIERQRLTFPIVDVPLAITGDDPKPSLRSSFLNNRLFWIGFAIPAAAVITDWLNLIYPSFPTLQLHDIEVGRLFAGMSMPWNAWSDLYVSIIFPVIGISYLVPTEVSLSLWLFYVLFRVHMLVWASFGVGPWGGGAAAVEPYVFASTMEAGGAVALCGVILYKSRGAIRAAWSGLRARDGATGDQYLPLSSRWALVGFVGANALMLWWLRSAGMSWRDFGLLMGMFYALTLCTGFLVASGGVMFVSYSASPSTVLLGTLGGWSFKPSSLFSVLALDSMFMREWFCSPMPQMVHTSKLFQTARIRGRSFVWAAALATGIAIVFGLIAILYTIHRHGANTLDQWPWTWPNWSVYAPLASNLRSPQMPDNWLRAAVGIGGCFVLILVWLQSRFIWWPLSPYGFLIASTYMMNHMMWVSVFIGWAAAAIVLRYGGLRLFRQVRPVFLGLVLGYYLPKLPITVLSAIFGITQRWGAFAY